MDNQTIIGIVSIAVDVIAVCVSVWSCIIANYANKKAEEAIKITQKFESSASQKGNNNLINSGNIHGNMIGEQNVK